MPLPDAEMLRLAELLIKQARESTSIKDCQCHICKGFMVESEDWLNMRAALETGSASFGLEINGEAQKVKKCPNCDRDFIGGASDRYCGGSYCLLKPMQL